VLPFRLLGSVARLVSMIGNICIARMMISLCEACIGWNNLDYDCIGGITVINTCLTRLQTCSVTLASPHVDGFIKGSEFTSFFSTISRSLSCVHCDAHVLMLYYDWLFMSMPCQLSGVLLPCIMTNNGVLLCPGGPLVVGLSYWHRGFCTSPSSDALFFTCRQRFISAYFS
jgi:hypothetical protein